MRELIRKILNEEVPSQVRRRIPTFEDTFKHYRDAFSKSIYRNFDIYWYNVMERVSETLYHAWFVNTVPEDKWEESEKYIQDYLTEKYYEDTKRWWEKKNRNRLNETGKDTKEIDESDKYTRAIKGLVKIYEDEDFVCDIDVEYYEAADAYIIIVKVDKKEMETYYEKETIWYATERIRDYLGDLYKNIYREVKTYFPVELAVHIKQTKCSKKLNESEEKNQSLLSLIDEHGLYEFMKMTGLSLKEIISKTGEPPRESLEKYIEDFMEDEAEIIAGSDGDRGIVYPIPLSKTKEVESFYLSKGVLTVEVNEYDLKGKLVAGSIERLPNLSDDEIYKIVKELIVWGGDDDYYEI